MGEFELMEDRSPTLSPGNTLIFIMVSIDVRFDASRHFLYLVRDRMLLMEWGVHLARFLFTIVFLSFPRCYAFDASRSTDLPFIFHGRISRVRCSLGQVRVRVSLLIFVSFDIYFLSLFRAKCDIAALFFTRWLSFAPCRATIWSTAPPCFMFVLHPLHPLRSACYFSLVIFYLSKLYFPLFLVHQGWLLHAIIQIKQDVVTGSSEILSQIDKTLS